MENIGNFKIEILGFTPEKMGDLLYHEGPLLTHFIDKKNPNDHYFYKWSDCDETCNRWLIFKVSEDILMDFFQQKCNLLDIIKLNPFVYFIDLDNDITAKQITLCSSNSIPEDYLPSKNSFFNEKNYEDYAKILKAKLLEKTQLIAVNSVLEKLLKEQISIKQEQRNMKEIQMNMENSLNGFLSIFFSKSDKPLKYGLSNNEISSNKENYKNN